MVFEPRVVRATLVTRPPGHPKSFGFSSVTVLSPLFKGFNLVLNLEAFLTGLVLVSAGTLFDF